MIAIRSGVQPDPATENAKKITSLSQIKAYRIDSRQSSHNELSPYVWLGNFHNLRQIFLTKISGDNRIPACQVFFISKYIHRLCSQYLDFIYNKINRQ